MNRSAFRAGSRGLVIVERTIERREISHDAAKADFDTMNKGLAVEAIPFEGVSLIGTTLWFDDKPDRSLFRALRRMTHVRRPPPTGGHRAL
jgi:hypothetical protein